MDYFIGFIILFIVLLIGGVGIYLYEKKKGGSSGGNNNSSNNTSSTCTPSCPTGQTCISSVCQPIPTNNNACGSGPACPFDQYCNNGKCESKTSCSSQDGCASGQYCSSGFCQPVTPPSASCGGMIQINGICQLCISNDQCGSTSQCIQGYCLPSVCAHNSDCVPSGIDPAATSAFTCSNQQCTVTPCTSCATGQYCAGVCLTKPSACTQDIDCMDTPGTLCYEGMCLRTCDINAPNSCSGEYLCAPAVAGAYYYGGESFNAICLQCDNKGNCNGPPDVKCASVTDCTTGLECTSGLCTEPPPNTSSCNGPGQYMDKTNKCQTNVGFNQFAWQEINLVSDTGISISQLQQKTQGTITFPSGIPTPVGYALVTDTSGGNWYQLPVAFVPDPTKQISTTYAPRFGFLDLWNLGFYTWDSGNQEIFSQSEVLTASYLTGTAGRVPYIKNGGIPNDSLMTYRGVPFCYNTPGHDGGVTGNSNDTYGPSVFTAYNSGGKYTCITPFMENNNPDQYSVDFGNGSISASPVYHSFIRGDSPN
jgi:hypothetical protein